MTHLALLGPQSRTLFDDHFLTPFGLDFPFPSRPTSRWTPPVDVFETDSEIRIEAEVPGAPRENIRLRHHQGVLTISGNRGDAVEHVDSRDRADGGNARHWVSRERRTGQFSRSFRLPDTVDPAGIRAEAHNGVLTVVIPKAEKALPRDIEVTVA